MNRSVTEKKESKLTSRGLGDPTISERNQMKEFTRLINWAKNNIDKKNNWNLTKEFLCNKKYYALAYEKLKSKPGNMTPGFIKETMDGISITWIENTIKKIIDGTIEFRPGRRIYIPKPGRVDKRPLTIGSPRDKLIQEIIRMVLEGLYEPTFSPNSYGFRPNKSCHITIKEILTKVKGVDYCIEGDIKKCFDSIDKSLLIQLLEEKIGDKQFISLIKKLCNAGYFYLNNILPSIAGVPQGSIISPILANIYLHKLDIFMENLTKEFNFKGKKKVNKEYRHLEYLVSKAKKNNDMNEVKRLHNMKMLFPSRDHTDTKILHYFRYADDFVIFIKGKEEDCIKVKEKIKIFLKEELKLILNEDKTKITNLNGNSVKFLGLNLVKSKGFKRKVNINGLTFNKRVHNMNLISNAPRYDIFSKLATAGFVKRFNKLGEKAFISKPKYSLMPLKKDEIISTYNSILRGLLNYYRFVHDYFKLAPYLYFLLKSSCEKTLAAKYSCKSRRAIRLKFRSNLKGNDKIAFYKPIMTNKTKYPSTMDCVDLINLYNLNGIKSLSLLDSISCKMCGSTSEIEMHHVKHLKDLNPKASPIDKFMSKIRRKQIPLCKNCHMIKHAQINKIANPI